MNDQARVVAQPEAADGCATKTRFETPMKASAKAGDVTMEDVWKEVDRHGCPGYCPFHDEALYYLPHRADQALRIMLQHPGGKCSARSGGVGGCSSGYAPRPTWAR